ncbi:hypothetical protein QCA50_010873 [Cerrena zonata]|uniref:Uncharacterized protein n=1 Tax=Cerrena zonata TaxID=2478898 RepID=A0AAW0FYL6_9APHY
MFCSLSLLEYPNRFLHPEVLDLQCLSDADSGNNSWHRLTHSLLLLSPSHLIRLTSSLLVFLAYLSRISSASPHTLHYSPSIVLRGHPLTDVQDLNHEYALASPNCSSDDSFLAVSAATPPPR